MHERDNKGRMPVKGMADRELLEEIVTSQRELADLVEKFVESIGKNPMLKMMAGKLGM